MKMSQPRSARRRAPVLIAVACGLGAGLLLAGPLAQLISARASAGSGGLLTNPFAAWSGGMGRQDVLILGTDVGGGNTDVIATLRIDGNRTSITQIPRDTYIELASSLACTRQPLRQTDPFDQAIVVGSRRYIDRHGTLKVACVRLDYPVRLDAVMVASNLKIICKKRVSPG